VDNGLQIKIDQHNQDDIDLFIRQALECCSDHIDAFVKEEIRRRIVSKASGMFIYAALKIRAVQWALQNFESVAGILRLIDNVSIELDHMYDKPLHLASETNQRDGLRRTIFLAIVRCWQLRLAPYANRN
jgi:hypothetical protein